MNLFSALALLFGAGVKNRIRRQLVRMRQPRFLIATLAGLFYFWQVLFRRWWLLTRPAPESPFKDLAVGQLRPVVELGLLALVLVQVLGAWTFGDERAQLAFTEAEVQFFFPAPASRLALVHYKLARGMLWLVLGALVSAALIGRVVSHQPLLFVAGAWVGLTALYLHRIASSFTRDRLAARGLLGRVVVWAAIAALAGAIAWSAYRTVGGLTPPAGAEPLEWVAGAAAQVSNARPLYWLVWPARALVRLALAPDGTSFLRALPAALAVAVVQYVWVVSSVTPFEEASAEAAELRGRMLESRRGQRRLPVIKNRRAPWSLAGTGRPEIALAWKNGLAVVRQFQPRGILLLGILGAVLLFFLGNSPEGAVARLATVASILVMLVLFGPIRLTLDLRHDVVRMDMLRALPLGGRQVVWAELLAPALVLTGFEWLLIAGGLAMGGGPSAPLPLAARAGLGAAAAILAPALTLLGLVIQNAAALLFPDWMSVFRDRRRGFDAMGQRLLTIAGSAVVIAVGAIPAALVGGAVLFVLWSFTPLYWSAAPIAGALAGSALAVESALGVAIVGRLFETHDVSQS